MLITDQVATAPCTDPIQVRFATFEAKPRCTWALEVTILCELKKVNRVPVRSVHGRLTFRNRWVTNEFL